MNQPAARAVSQSNGSNAGEMTMADSDIKGINQPMRDLGKYTARRLFEARGNKSEIHITEADLALAIGAAAQAAWTSAINAVQRVREQTDREIEDESTEIG